MNRPNHKIKVVVMALSPLTERWAEYFCTDTLYEEFDFEYWDCSHIAYPCFTTNQSLYRPYVVTILSREMLKQCMRELPKDTLFLSGVFFAKENKSFHRMVAKYLSNCIYIDMWTYSWTDSSITGVSPVALSSQEPESLFVKFKHWIYQCDPLRLVIKFIRYHGDNRFKREYQIYLSSKEMRAIESAANYGRKQYKNVFELSTKRGGKYAINHPDVDKCIKLKGQPPICSGRYIVYLDQYFPLHPDMDESEPGIDHASMAEPFYRSLNRFFSEVEEHQGCKVIIAAHPAADYRNNPFDGREILFYKTAELVKDCLGVCMHYSSAANFVALYDKPFVVFENNVTRQSPAFTNGLHIFANTVNAPIINIDEYHKSTEDFFGCLDEKLKKAFLDTFCDRDSILSNKELFPKHLKAIYKELES